MEETVRAYVKCVTETAERYFFSVAFATDQHLSTDVHASCRFENKFVSAESRRYRVKKFSRAVIQAAPLYSMVHCQAPLSDYSE